MSPVTSTSSVPGPVTSGRRPLTPGPVSRVSSSDPAIENNVFPVINKIRQLIKKRKLVNYKSAQVFKAFQGGRFSSRLRFYQPALSNYATEISVGLTRQIRVL
jgi:hypothetical protein